jgi:hypothetical protein
MTISMVIMKIIVSWDETPCSLENQQHFEGTGCFHLKINVARSSETWGTI